MVFFSNGHLLILQIVPIVLIKPPELQTKVEQVPFHTSFNWRKTKRLMMSSRTKHDDYRSITIVRIETATITFAYASSPHVIKEIARITNTGTDIQCATGCYRISITTGTFTVGEIPFEMTVRSACTWNNQPMSDFLCSALRTRTSGLLCTRFGDYITARTSATELTVSSETSTGL